MVEGSRGADPSAHAARDHPAEQPPVRRRAVADLDRSLQREPRNAQALLTRATVLTVQGKYAQARADCERLAASLREIYAAICVPRSTA